MSVIFKISNSIKRKNRYIMTILGSMHETVQSQYGKGIFSYVKSIYYSLFSFNTFVVFELNLEKKFPEYEVDPEFEVITPNRSELDMLRKDKQLPKEFYNDVLNGTKKCYILTKGKDLAYIHWVCVEGDHARFTKLQKNTARITYALTMPAYRGNKLYSKMISLTAKDLKLAGYKKLVSVANEHNIAAIKSLQKMGYQEVRRIRSMGPFNRSIEI